METYAEEEETMSQPQDLLISSFTLWNGTLMIAMFLLVSFEMGLVCTKTRREHTPRNCFNSFIQ